MSRTCMRWSRWHRTKKENYTLPRFFLLAIEVWCNGTRFDRRVECSLWHFWLFGWLNSCTDRITIHAVILWKSIANMFYIFLERRCDHHKCHSSDGHEWKSKNRFHDTPEALPVVHGDIYNISININAQ